MSINIDRVLDKLMFDTNLKNLKWDFEPKSDIYSIYVTEFKITENKKIIFTLYRYLKNPRLTNIMIHFSIEDKKIFIHTINYNEISKKMTLLIESLDRKMKRKEL